VKFFVVGYVEVELYYEKVPHSLDYSPLKFHERMGRAMD
jgi:hypothetical protein